MVEAATVSHLKRNTRLDGAAWDYISSGSVDAPETVDGSPLVEASCVLAEPDPARSAMWRAECAVSVHCGVANIGSVDFAVTCGEVSAALEEIAAGDLTGGELVVNDIVCDGETETDVEDNVRVWGFRFTLWCYDTGAG